MPAWGARRFESADTHRLNQAHWEFADDQSVNTWLANQLSIVRARANYEARQNGTVLGVINTHADDIVGPDGPTLQVISDDPAYNQALEQAWKKWFASPTYRPNISGAQWLKLRIRSLWKNGEFIDQLITDPQAEGPIKLRLRPIHPRRLCTPVDLTGDPNVFMGIRFDGLGRPAQYYISSATPVGMQTFNLANFVPIPPDLMIHEFIAEEEDQARGVPWLNTALQPSADLRDYKQTVHHAARRSAAIDGMLCTTHVDVQPWLSPEETRLQDGTIPMAPPGWTPQFAPPNQPPVQFVEYVSEGERPIGRPMGMPLLMIRLDSARHNYSSARLDTQTYGRACNGLQYWISGTEQSYGTLNRLVDTVAAEGRFSIPALRRRPALVTYKWTWPARPHVDPAKEALAEETSLETRALTLTDAVAARGKSIESHIATLVRERQLFEEAELPLPVYMTDQPGGAGKKLRDVVDAEDAAAQAASNSTDKEPVEA
jgi:lambda family phage portal protein